MAIADRIARNRSSRHRRRRLLGVVGVSIVLLALGSAHKAYGDFSTGWYTHSGSSCSVSTRVDPVNVVFYGFSADSVNARVHMEHHSGWTDSSGSSQWFTSHGYCTGMDGQRASGSGSRFHLRFNQTHHKDTLGRYETVSDAHHEDWVIWPWPCGHAVDKGTVSEPTSNGSGFDQGRAEVFRRFSGTNHTILSPWKGDLTMSRRGHLLIGTAALVIGVGAIATASLLSSGVRAASGTDRAELPACPNTDAPSFARYFAGDAFDGAPLTRATRGCEAATKNSPGRANAVSYIYGDCTPASDRGCAPPLEIQVWPACERNLSVYELAEADEPELLTVRGVPAALFGDSRLELYTVDATVVVFGQTREHGLAVAGALRSAPGSGGPGVSARSDLPAPAAGARDGRLTC